MRKLGIITTLLTAGWISVADIQPVLAQVQAVPSRPTPVEGKERPERRDPDRRDHRRPDRPERVRPERPERPERRDRPEPSARPERVERSTRK